MIPSAYTKIAQILADCHAQDPRPKTFATQTYPYETIYAQRMLHWTKHMQPDASEELLLAVDAQHLERWKLPRESYPMDRKGYLLWREELKKRHAADLAELMSAAGYSAESIAKTTELIRRKQMAPDAEGQILEDAACLVFLELDFSELAEKTEHTKMISILQKTWKKMSDRGHALALSLPLSTSEKILVTTALA